MYSSMHPLGGRVNRVERTLLNFFMWRGVRGGIFRAPEGRFAGDFGSAARREWAVSPRNSGVFEWGAGAARRFSARRTVPGTRGEKIFKNFLKEGWKTEKLGCGRGPEGGLGAPYMGCAGSGEAGFRSGHETSSSVARGAVNIRDSLLVIYRGPPASSIAHSIEVSLLVRPAILQPSPVV